MEELVRHKKRRHESEATNPWDWEEGKTKQRKKQTTQEEIDFLRVLVSVPGWVQIRRVPSFKRI